MEGTEQSKEESSKDVNVSKSSSSSVDQDERKLLAGSYWLVRILFIRSFSAIYCKYSHLVVVRLRVVGQDFYLHVIKLRLLGVVD